MENISLRPPCNSVGYQEMWLGEINMVVQTGAIMTFPNDHTKCSTCFPLSIEVLLESLRAFVMEILVLKVDLFAAFMP